MIDQYMILCAKILLTVFVAFAVISLLRFVLRSCGAGAMWSDCIGRRKDRRDKRKAKKEIKDHKPAWPCIYCGDHSAGWSIGQKGMFMCRSDEGSWYACYGTITDADSSMFFLEGAEYWVVRDNLERRQHKALYAELRSEDEVDGT